MQAPHIAILGAGSVGGYVGGSLRAADRGSLQVTLIGRERYGSVFRQHGMRLTSLAGGDRRLAPSDIDFSTDAARLAQADLILVCVKSTSTADAAQAIARHAKAGALVLSLQNGVHNAEQLRTALPGHLVLAGMVPFNVAHLGEGHLHRGTAGEIAVERSAALRPWLAHFAAAALPLRERSDMSRVQWGKLLLNLNNAVNALSDLPLKQQLQQRDYRAVLAACLREALAAMRAQGIRPAAEAGVPAVLLPWILELPDALYVRVARRALAIDERARSSMWDDLRAGRATEIDQLNGEIVALAARQGLRAPVNETLVRLVHGAENSGSPPRWTAEALRQACGLR